MTAPELDRRVLETAESLTAHDVPRPDFLWLSATGFGDVLERLFEVREHSLVDVAGVPEPWRTATLVSARLGSSRIWMLEDVGTEPIAPLTTDAWVGGFPVWLAAKCGAAFLLHTTAGSTLVEHENGPTAGGFAVLADHINASARNPLTGLGASELGPLFPDTQFLHHAGLRSAALERARENELVAAPAIAVCTPGPALETPAERTMWSRLGADVAVQELATPLLSAAHAGLPCLTLVALTDRGEGPLEVTRLLEVARETQPKLDTWILALASDFEATARDLREDD